MDKKVYKTYDKNKDSMMGRRFKQAARGCGKSFERLKKTLKMYFNQVER